MNLKACWLLLASLACALFSVAPARAQAAATLEAPAAVPAGSKIEVKWTGPGKESDRIGVLPAGSPDSTAPKSFSAYARRSPVLVPTPEQPGEYELRYLSYRPSGVLVRRKLTVQAVTASVQAPAAVPPGSKVAVSWTGPDNEFDRVGVVPAGAPDTAKPLFASYLKGTNPVLVVVPEKPGEYELRYLTGQSATTLARAKLSVGGTAASLEAPATAIAAATLEVGWKGPGNEFDRITIAPAGSPEEKWAVSEYVRPSPMSIRAPVTSGPYEVRYQTGQSQAILARSSLEVTPAQHEPGMVRVTATAGAVATGGAVELILDASGSMLQKLGERRRIDIAKQTLLDLTSKTIPAGTPFAFRVFGREANSCQTDLELKLAPLDVAVASAKIASLEAKSGAKTPIGASLEQVASDLKSVKGERLVVLVTDGEETCGGDPERAIQKLMKSGIGVRVNIVGFAVDDAKLAASFRAWSQTGNGTYFDAQDQAGLDQAMSLALAPGFEVLDAQKKVVASGVTGSDAVALMPGSYSVRLKGRKGTKSVTVRARETASVNF